MDESGLKKIKRAFAAAKRSLASIRARRSRILKKDATSVDSSNVEDIRSKIGKL